MTTVVAEDEVYVHHIPQASDDPDAPWMALCNQPMPLDHHVVWRRGKVRVCETCGLVFKTQRRRSRALN